MEIVYAIIASILVVIGIAFISHFYDTNGKRLPVSEPFFLPKNSDKYYISLKCILENYFFCSFAKAIMKDGEVELRNAFGLYKSNCTQTANWGYVKDLCECSDYECYVFDAWAIIYIHTYLEEIITYHKVNTAEKPVVLELKKYIDKRYSGIVDDGTVCPQSFIDNFS